MLRLGVTLLVGSACLGLAGRAEEAGPPREAVPDNNPYLAIVSRNAFRLKDPLPPPPPPTNPPPAPEAPKLDVKLAGLGEINGVRYAYLMLPDTERPGQFVYPALTDNSERGRVRHGSGLEIREIDLRKQTVRLVNGGIEATLNLKEHGVKAAPAPAPGAKPGVPAPGVQPGVGNVPRPPGAAAVAAPGADRSAPSAEPIIFSRNPNRASNSTMPAGIGAGSLGVPHQPVSGGGTVNFPTRPLRTDASAPQTSPAMPVVPVEQQYEVLIRQRQAAEAVGIQLPPIPGMPSPGEPH